MSHLFSSSLDCTLRVLDVTAILRRRFARFPIAVDAHLADCPRTSTVLRLGVGLLGSGRSGVELDSLIQC
jgi:hypothetical protein